MTGQKARMRQVSLRWTPGVRDLGVTPVWSTEDAVARTMRWYARQVDGADARELCDADIDAYEAAA